MDNEKLNDIDKYKVSYSEENLLYKIKRFARKAGLNTIYYVLILYNLLKSDKISISEKAIIIAALGYFISPLDMVPDLMPGIGFTDDAAILMMVIKQIYSHIDESVKQDAKNQLKEWFDFEDSELEDI